MASNSWSRFNQNHETSLKRVGTSNNLLYTPSLQFTTTAAQHSRRYGPLRIFTSRRSKHLWRPASCSKFEKKKKEFLGPLPCGKLEVFWWWLRTRKVEVEELGHGEWCMTVRIAVGDDVNAKTVELYRVS